MSEYVYATNGVPLRNVEGSISLPREKIVRCGSCRHYDLEFRECHKHDINTEHVCANDFCAWGDAK